MKRAIAFAWIAGGWDADRDGVLEGAQHNTYDVEFYGPNPLCGIYYLGALRAVRGDGAAPWATRRRARSARGSSSSGRAWIDANLFNGEYYIQQVHGQPREQIAPALLSTMGSDDGAPEYQVGDGCLADQLIGQYLAEVAGLGPLRGSGKHAARRSRASTGTTTSGNCWSTTTFSAPTC